MDIIQNMFRSIGDPLNGIVKPLNIRCLRCGFWNFIEFACKISLISTITYSKQCSQTILAHFDSELVVFDAFKRIEHNLTIEDVQNLGNFFQTRQKNFQKKLASYYFFARRANFAWYMSFKNILSCTVSHEPHSSRVVVEMSIVN